MDGYFDSPWPGEDGGPQRLQFPKRGKGLALQPGEQLKARTRNTLMSTMTVLGAPDEVFLLTHSAVRSKFGLPTSCRVERIHPTTLQTLSSSPRLPGGPMWPGGMAVHRNGDLFVVYGRYLHRLNRQCQVLAALELPVNAPYNSFVILENGLLVTKNISDTQNARLTVIRPDPTERACADLDCPEPSIARLSAIGNTLYVVGVRSIFRYHWSDMLGRLVFDDTWRHDYISGTGQSYGWDVVLDGQHAWFMDNGKHRYFHKMIGAGVHQTANRLIRVSLTDASDVQALDISGVAGGSVTNPPLVDLQRRIVLGYDSANRHLRAWRFHANSHALTPLWHKTQFGCASHMVLFPDTGEVAVNDYRRYGEEVVLLDIASGDEKGRVRIAGFNQGVVFPSAGWGRDFYWSSMSKVARIFVSAKP